MQSAAILSKPHGERQPRQETLSGGHSKHKYYPKTDKTPKGHMNQQRKNVRFTKTPFEECHAVAALQRKKMKDIYVRTYDTRETSFSDQTGQFPKQSKRGHKYIMVLIEIDSNAIMVEEEQYWW